MARNLLILSVFWLAGCEEEILISQQREVLSTGNPWGSDGASEARVNEVDLDGYERSGPWTIERFRTRPIEKLDLIWVIDSSQSMDEEQAKIARSLARFREVIADRRVDGRFNGGDIGVCQERFKFRHSGRVVPGADAQNVLGVRVAKRPGSRLPIIEVFLPHGIPDIDWSGHNRIESGDGHVKLPLLPAADQCQPGTTDDQGQGRCS